MTFLRWGLVFCILSSWGWAGTKNKVRTPTPAARVFQLDPKASSLQFHGDATLHSFDADVQSFSGRAELRAETAGKDLAEDLASAQGKITLEVKSIKTGEEGRDTEMLKRLEADKYPQMIFILKSAAAMPNQTDDGRVIEDLGPNETKCMLKGELAVKGKPMPVTGKGKCFRTEEGGWRAEGEAPVNMKDYGIDPPSVALVVNMDAEVLVRYKLVFRQSKD